MSAKPELPLCCITGRIAGDSFACGDCDPCGAAHAVPASVKTFLEERDHFAGKYSEAACECDFLRAELASARKALRTVQQMIRGEIVENAVVDVNTKKTLGDIVSAALKDDQPK